MKKTQKAEIKKWCGRTKIDNLAKTLKKHGFETFEEIKTINELNMETMKVPLGHQQLLLEAISDINLDDSETDNRRKDQLAKVKIADWCKQNNIAFLGPVFKKHKFDTYDTIAELSYNEKILNDIIKGFNLGQQKRARLVIFNLAANY